MSDNSTRPEGANITEDLDMTLISSWPLYTSQQVKLAACEKGIAWKEHVIDVASKFEHLEPWYLELNPEGNFVTMLVKPNLPITDKKAMVEYVENNFSGTCSLAP